jgi:TATA-box binding protein (TBP) (component of TFIID and TFIIIB)
MEFPICNIINEDEEDMLLSILEKKNKKKIELPEVGFLNISVKTACCYIDKTYNIKKMAQSIEEKIKKDSSILKAINYTKTEEEGASGILVKNSKSNNNFYNSICITVCIRENKNINLMIFTNGRITCTGSKNDDDGYIAANYLLDEMKLDVSIFENEEDAIESKIVNYDIVMINSNFSIGFMIDNHKLYDILISKRSYYHLFSSFDPRTYQGVKIYFMWNINQLIKNGVCACSKKKCKISAKKKNGNGDGDCRRISVAVFGTGKILIAGAKNNTQLYDTYNFIIKLLQENYEKISQYNMEDKRRIIRIGSSKKLLS